MKSILATALIVCSLNAFAGPEDHISVQTCYKLKSTYITNAIPERICLEEISVNSPETTQASLNIYSYFNQSYFEGMALTYIARRNENGFSFRAANVLVETFESGCGSAEKVTLQIYGQLDNDGVGQPEYVDVSVKHETQNDTCHSKLQTEILEYIKE